MMDTLGVGSARLILLVAVCLAGFCSCRAQTAGAWGNAVASAARLAPEARIVVLDVGAGHLLAASHLAEAARTLAAPGSTLKPLALYGLVARGRWDPSRRITCTRTLTIGGRSLNCSHPAADPMDARLALAWSCNTYFATVAGTLAPGELRKVLAPTGLLAQTSLASNEATAVFRDPQSPDQNRLALLGVDGILVTPLELAVAYRWLALQIAAHPETAAVQVVQAGLADSASFGMAGAASLGGVAIDGKTGTAGSAAGPQTHGWFIGLAPAGAPRAVIAVYLPAGHGTDAARIAGELLAHSPLRKKP
ncbi:MAG: penicillin-binding transpeptidase domain-containing protein [Terracidiphilus sp.]|jgi:cell division protein FtsI/penicillin-binding protein 2